MAAAHSSTVPSRIDVDELDLESQVSEDHDLIMKIGTRHATVLFVVVSGNENDDDVVEVRNDRRSSQRTVQVHPEPPVDGGVSIEREELIREEQRGKIHGLRLRKPAQVEMIRDSIPKVALQCLDGVMQLRVVNPPLRIALHVILRRLGVDSRIELEVVKTVRERE